MARCAWALVDQELLEHVIARKEHLARNWLFSMIETRMTVTLWAIWTARRKLIHEDIHRSPLSTHLFVTRFIAELDHVNLPASQAAPTPAGGGMRERWIPPPVGYVKVNVDAGVFVEHNVGTASAICRDRDGTYLGSSILVIHGMLDPSSLEAIVCREALSLAEDLGMQHLHIASDGKEVVKHIHDGAGEVLITVSSKKSNGRRKHLFHVCSYMKVELLI